MRRLLPLLLILSACGPTPQSSDRPGAPPSSERAPADNPDPQTTPGPWMPGAPPTAEGDALPEGEASQSLVPEDVAREKLARWLTDPLAVAQPGELADRPPWDSMGRRPQTPPKKGWTKPRLWQQVELPTGPAVHLLTGVMDAEQWAEAETLATARIQADPDDAQARALLGWALTELDRVAEAEATLVALLEDYPGYVDGWVELGILRSNDRRLAGSLLAFDRALDLREGWEARLGRGIALCRGGAFAEAEYDLWKAVEADPTDGNAYYDLGWIAAQQGKGARAAGLLRFAARSPRLLAVRICQEVLMDDTYFEPVWRDAGFLKWLKRMPEACIVPERNSPLTLTKQPD
jgi:tetratricopeptide (TPR) repeat protein